MLFPLIGGLAITALYLYSLKSKLLPDALYGWIGSLAPVLSFCAFVVAYFKLEENNGYFQEHLFTWVHILDLKIDFALSADNLSIFMGFFITFVGSLIHIYASVYMKKDEAYGKFFAFFNLFLASMLLLVFADNLMILFLGWEGVGLFSYFLVAFYYRSKENVDAGNKAMIANRIGDLGFLLGIVVLFSQVGAGGLDFKSLSQNIDSIPHYILVLSGILFFVGAMGKSAQIPLYVWLPDAMAGPTPVSALIHAATMVTAGVYMVAKLAFLYNEVPNIGVFIAYIGAFGALLAAIMATKAQDIKKILAYSTMSQLGYMFIGVGLGMYSAGLFHVLTHSFFKALLFMSAGAILLMLHHKQNIFDIAKHQKHTPALKYIFLIGVLAISGIPPLSGFISKDAIIVGSFAQEQYLIYAIALFTAFLTAFYMFRIYFVVFVAPYNAAKKSNTSLQEYKTPWLIIAPLCILAFGSIFVGFINTHFLGTHFVDDWLSYLNPREGELSASTEGILVIASIVVAVLGVALAYVKYASWDINKKEDDSCIIGNRFYVDEFYHIAFVTTYKNASVFISNYVEKWIDNIIMFIPNALNYIASPSSKVFNNANVRIYGAFIMISICAIFVYLYIKLFGVLS